MVTPYVGVWIETSLTVDTSHPEAVTPYVGVWIETIKQIIWSFFWKSHPTWVCGLKQKNLGHITLNQSHTLRGCVD